MASGSHQVVNYNNTVHNNYYITMALRSRELVERFKGVALLSLHSHVKN